MQTRKNKCKTSPYEWKTRSVMRSPFHTLEYAKKTLKNYKAGKPIGFTAHSSLKSMGKLPRSSGCYILGMKYRP